MHGDGRTRPERHNGDMQEVSSKPDDSKKPLHEQEFWDLDLPGLFEFSVLGVDGNAGVLGGVIRRCCRRSASSRSTACLRLSIK